jgi:hypothetical protein
MGSQQLFLLVLGLLLVALVLFTGFQFTGDYYENVHREKLLEEIQSLQNNAIQYKKKAIEFGGGSGSFIGWTTSQNRLINDNHTIKYVAENNRITFFAEGTVVGWDDKEGIKMWVRYSDKTGRTVRYLN